MNRAADLLGFHDPSPAKPMWWSWCIWQESFPCLACEGLSVSYGGGKEFKMDTKWPSKMEANVLEALVGAMDEAGLDNLVKATSCLCLLSLVAPPRAVLPSNWQMAEYVLAMLERNPLWVTGDTAVMLPYLDNELLANEMERWLERGCYARTWRRAGKLVGPRTCDSLPASPLPGSDCLGTLCAFRRIRDCTPKTAT
jgi:hypothetical protein